MGFLGVSKDGGFAHKGGCLIFVVLLKEKTKRISKKKRKKETRRRGLVRDLFWGIHCEWGRGKGQEDVGEN